MSNLLFHNFDKPGATDVDQEVEDFNLLLQISSVIMDQVMAMILMMMPIPSINTMSKK